MDFWMLKNDKWLLGWHRRDMSREQCWVWLLLHCLASTLDKGRKAGDLNRRGYFEIDGVALTREEIADRITEEPELVFSVLDIALEKAKMGENSECYCLPPWEKEQAFRTQDALQEAARTISDMEEAGVEDVHKRADAFRSIAGLPTPQPPSEEQDDVQDILDKVVKKPERRVDDADRQ